VNGARPKSANQQPHPITRSQVDLRNGINPDAPLNELLTQSPSEANNSAFGGGIIDHASGTAESDNTGGVDDAATLGDMRQRELGQRHHLEDVAAKGALHGLDVQVFEVLTLHLLARVVDQNVKTSELLHVRGHNLVQVFELLEIVRYAETLAAGFLDEALGLLGVLLLLREVDDGDIAAFAGVEGGYGTSGVLLY
jgi:hypothetical protein